jgi:hypothetical protein
MRRKVITETAKRTGIIHRIRRVIYEITARLAVWRCQPG